MIYDFLVCICSAADRELRRSRQEGIQRVSVILIKILCVHTFRTHFHIQDTFIHSRCTHGGNFAKRVGVLLKKRLLLNVFEHRESLLLFGIKLFACNCVAPLAGRAAGRQGAGGMRRGSVPQNACMSLRVWADSTLQLEKSKGRCAKGETQV